MKTKFGYLLWPCLLALPPVAAVIGCIITAALLARHPDHEIRVVPEATLSQEETRHVTNSVVPPLR